MTPDKFATTLFQIRAARDGDRAAVDDLFARYHPRLYRIVTLRLGSVRETGVEIEDVVQEAMLEAFTKLDMFAHRSEGTFLDWLSQIALNKFRDRLKGDRRLKRGGGRVRAFTDIHGDADRALEFSAPNPLPSEFARAREIADAETAALEQVRDDYRDVIIRRDHCGMTFAEIAVLLGYAKADPARALYARAKQKLCTLLDAHRPTVFLERERADDGAGPPQTDGD